MKYRLIDYFDSRGYTGIDNDRAIESNLDIHEVAESLLKERFQEMYDNWKVGNPDYFTMGDEPFLYCTTEFFGAREVNDSQWFLENGEERGRILIQENDPLFSASAKDIVDEFYENTSWYDNEQVYSFETFTGTEPYAQGLWEKGFDPAKALLDAGIIKETV